MSAESATQNETSSLRKSKPLGKIVSGVVSRRGNQLTTTILHKEQPSFALVFEHNQEQSQEAHLFQSIEDLLSHSFTGDNARIVRIPHDLIANERGIWDCIRLADSEKRSIPIPKG